ncbi:MBL fold metallo-hydrolase [Candidatus Azambacteria bacterium]|nr:MBL fold metallo-hydrolase [Candidatus Azambacteria bacterium]
MTISWYGEACFLLESGGIRILIEPPQKESGINPPRLKSDVLIYSKSGQTADTEAFVIDGPGEYEIKGVSVLGVADGKNTIYNMEIDDIKISHLGFLSEDLDSEKTALIGDPDIVLVPVGGSGVLDAETAMTVINKIGPSIVIPMLYDIKGLKIKRAPLSAFLKESEADGTSQPKLAIKKKDINENETKIVILEKV